MRSSVCSLGLLWEALLLLGLEEVGVGVVQVEALVGDHQGVGLVRGSLHLLLRVATRVRAPVVAPATTKNTSASMYAETISTKYTNVATLLILHLPLQLNVSTN
jgi:hypothetical protein